jgi:pyruvate kinase
MASALDHQQVGGRIEWLSQLNTTYAPERTVRRTSIICTIGPRTNSVEAINKLRDAGLNVVRMNFSHGDHKYHQSVIDNAREAERVQPGRQIAIALDTKHHWPPNQLGRGHQQAPRCWLEWYRDQLRNVLADRAFLVC